MREENAERIEKGGGRMKIPKHIRQKMHKIAEFSHKSGELSSEVDAWFEAHGYDIAELRCGDGCSLEELNYGNDVVYAFCERIENGDFCSYGERKTND